MSDHDEDLSPHEEDDIDLSIYGYDTEYRRWYKTPVDLEHVHRENAERKETENKRLLSGSYREMEDAVPVFMHNSLYQVQCLPPEGEIHFYMWREGFPHQPYDYSQWDEYHCKLQRLKDKVVWRINVDKHINRRYEVMSSFLRGCKYRLGTRYLGRIVKNWVNGPIEIHRMSRRRQYEWVSQNEAESLKSVLEIIEMLTWGGTTKKTTKEWRVNARMTYDREFGLVEDVLKKAHNDAYSDYECEEAAKFGKIFRSRLVNIYRDDRLVEVAVRAFMEHNLPLMRDTIDAWEVYNDAMKPFYRYQTQYEELRETKRNNKARRLSEKRNKETKKRRETEIKEANA